MARTVGLGYQNFEQVIKNNNFYIDKTLFIKECEAYLNGYWDELSNFIRSLFNSTFKENPHLDRALMTGITRVSKESIFLI